MDCGLNHAARLLLCILYVSSCYFVDVLCLLSLSYIVNQLKMKMRNQIMQLLIGFGLACIEFGKSLGPDSGVSL